MQAYIIEINQSKLSGTCTCNSVNLTILSQDAYLSYVYFSCCRVWKHQFWRRKELSTITCVSFQDLELVARLDWRISFSLANYTLWWGWNVLKGTTWLFSLWWPYNIALLNEYSTPVRSISLIGHLQEYPTMHYFELPSQFQIIKTFKILN